jgi:hypothetical protein
MLPCVNQYLLVSLPKFSADNSSLDELRPGSDDGYYFHWLTGYVSPLDTPWRSFSIFLNDSAVTSRKPGNEEAKRMFE